MGLGNGIGAALASGTAGKSRPLIGPRKGRELEDFLAGTGKVEAAQGSGMGGETAVVNRGDFGKCEGEGEEEEKEKESEVKEEKVKEKLKELIEKWCEVEDGKGRRMHRSQMRQRVEL